MLALASMLAAGTLSGAVASEPSASQPQPAVELEILRRPQWKAKEPAGPMTAHEPVFITVHHTGAPANRRHPLAVKLRSLQEFSQKPGKLDSGRLKPAWADLPYHYYIDVSGEIGEGRDPGFAGDTNTNYDPRGHIGVVLEGNFEAADPTPEQLTALEDLLVWLTAKRRIPVTAIRGHRQLAQTLCPGSRLLALLPEIRARVAQRLDP